jgi:hypothetical protein
MAGAFEIGWEQFEAASLRLAGVTLRGTLAGAHPAPGGAWTLAPLAAADGTLRAEIVDAHLLFDADVTVPIRHGQVDFDDATVEHLGPDSRMGISPEGLYVDAANGRTYVYRFATSSLAGVDYERRAALLTPLVSDRGKLRLQEFVEGLLRQPADAQSAGLTAQSRLLLDRTSLSGELQPGDGLVAAPGLQGELAGAVEGRNALRIHSDALARGLRVEIPTLRIRNVVLQAKNAQLHCDEVTGALALRLAVEGGQVHFELELAEVLLSGVRVHP